MEIPIPLPGRTDSTLYWKFQNCVSGLWIFTSCPLLEGCLELYLLDVSDVHQLDHFILFGAAGSGTGALEAQVTNREKGINVR